MSRAWSLALPIVTVLVVAYALLVAGVPRGARGVRVYGGPSEGRAALSLRVESVQREGESESPSWNAPLAVTASSGGARVEASIAHAVDGVADFTLAFPRPIHGPVELEVHDASGALLAQGKIELDGAHWAARARRRGGWVRGRADNALVVSLAPQRGAFVVGVSDPLTIRVERGGNAVAGAVLTVSAQGARVSQSEPLRTDLRGRARIGFEAIELNPTLRIEARSAAGESGSIDSGVPVVPGGFHGEATAGGLRIECAVPRTEAFYSVVSDSGRIAGGVVRLSPNGRGGSLGMVATPLPAQPTWFVLSSEVDQNTAAAIGWPLVDGAEPGQTFDVPEALLLDGLPGAFAREQARRSHVRWLTAAFIALAFALSVVLLVVRVRAADRDISRHLSDALEAETVARIAPRRSLSLLVSLLVIGLGFVALGLIVAARSR